MRIYVSADIEGVTGIAHWDEANKEHAAYRWFADRMNAEVAAACDGALLGGATDLLIKDAHGSGRNLLPDRLPRPARLIRGWSGHPFRMVQGLDDTFAGVAFVGYHSPCGTGGHPLSHTLSGRFAHIEVNGRRLSELRLHSWLAASVGVPTLFVAGDAGICTEADALFPGIPTVATGRGDGHSTVGEHPSVVIERLRDGMAAAVRRAPDLRPEALPERFELRVRFRVHHEAVKASHYPGASRVADDSVALTTREVVDVARALLFW